MKYPLEIGIVSAYRTAVGRALKGCFAYTRPETLAATCLRQAWQKMAPMPAERVDDVVLGCAMPEAEQGLNIARQAVFLADLPDSVAAQTVNRFCASGLQAIAHAAAAIATHSCEVVLAGGVESMSMVPMSGNKVSLHPDLVATRPEVYINMGHTAERVAAQFGVSREAQDAFALRSHQLALAAQKNNVFAEEIVPVVARGLSTQLTETGRAVVMDECPRAGTTLEGLANLKPSFKLNGTVTAGNSSPLSDGAAAVLLMNAAQIAHWGTAPLGYIRAFTSVGVAPEIMGIGPVPAIDKLLKKYNLKVADIALFEINEAFAAQAVYVQRTLGIADAQLNVHGGAIALGHPLGCTGAKLVVQMVHALRRRGGGLGVVSMCIGGGMGAAALMEVPA